MRTFRRLILTTLAAAALLAVSTPAFAQATNPPVPHEQGLGVFVQGGYVWQSLFGPDKDFLPNSPQGFIVGIGFGGNKSGAWGFGADINYVWTTVSDGGDDLKTQYLNIPVYARFNIGGHQTKNRPTFFIPVGWFFDVNLANKFSGVDVKDSFNGLQTGPMVGAGFEVARIGVEGRGQWAIMKLLKDGEGVDAKQFTFILLFKVRLN